MRAPSKTCSMSRCACTTHDGSGKKQETADKSRRTTELAHARQLTREAERQARAHAWQPPPGIAVRPLPQKLKVLVFAANPLDQGQLRLDEEVRAITEKLRLSKHGDQVELVSAWAVRTTDLFQALNEHEPHVVHFSGHGSAADEIVFQDELGSSKFVSKGAMTELIAATGGHIRLIVFNTCFSRNQAEAVVQHVEAAIGVGASLDDDGGRRGPVLRRCLLRCDRLRALGGAGVQAGPCPARR